MNREKPLTYQGETLSRAEWAKRLGISRAALSARLKHLAPEEALRSKPRERPRGTKKYRSDIEAENIALKARIALLESTLLAHHLPLP